ncbi:rab-GTPase-TBC domain-containing protein [Geranomyces variabilis]|nr:rab-GTPase-TBC domain-containing protein [Geranomyces variabilis]KAJ3143486.1 GTPase activating protein [Geranomyces variabilis]
MTHHALLGSPRGEYISSLLHLFSIFIPLTMQLLFALPNVSIRSDELNPLLGFLCLAREQDEAETLLLSFVPLGRIPRADSDVYARAAANTKRARKTLHSPSTSSSPSSPATAAASFSALSISSHTTILSSPPAESISAPLTDIATLAIGRELTLNARAEEICLSRLVVALALGGDDGGKGSSSADAAAAARPLAQLPDLWFEKDELGRAPSVADVEDDLRVWFAAVGRGMTKLLRERDPQETSVLTYFSLDPVMGAWPSTSSSSTGDPQQQQPIARPSSPQKWPESWPAVPEGIHRFGTFGYSMVTNIVGQPMAAKMEDAGWNLLERFSKVTNYAKNTTVQVLEHPLARPFVPYIPQNVRSYFLSSAEAEALLAEYEPAGQYIARFAADLQSRLTRPGGAGHLDHQTPVMPVKDTTRDFENLAAGRHHHRTGQPLSAEQWTSWYGPDGRLTRSEQEIKAIVFAGGVENDVRVDVWKYLLKVYPFTSTEAERAEIAKRKRAQYEDIKSSWQSIYNDAARAEAALAAAAAAASQPHLVANRTTTQAGDEKEDADVVTKIRERKYRVDKDVVRTDRTVPFFSDSNDDTGGVTPVTPGDMHDVVSASANLAMLSNVLVTYTMYGDFELGYVQGMNDLLAPVLVVMRDEADAFWCFVEFMEMMKPNFYRDQSGMRTQLRQLELLIKFMDPYLYSHMESTDSINLFCCFRWLLILFKREFEFSDCMRLWETLWACPLTKNMHLFVAFAILNRERRELLGKVAFDETLKFINDLSTRIHLESTLERAEVLFEVFRDRIGDAARETLGVDLAVDAGQKATASAQTSTRGSGVEDEGDDDVVLLSVPTGATRAQGARQGGGGASGSESGSAGGGVAGEAGVVRCTDEELWELVGLLERRG